MLTLSRTENQRFIVDHRITIKIDRIQKDQHGHPEVKVSFDAPDDVQIDREEIYNSKYPDGPPDEVQPTRDQLLSLLLDITHHSGAVEEFRPTWQPIVIAELRRRSGERKD